MVPYLVNPQGVDYTASAADLCRRAERQTATLYIPNSSVMMSDGRRR